MRVTYRKNSAKEYWTKRWTSIQTDEPMENTSVYPLKYALQGISLMRKGGKILEAGCGNGRILRWLYEHGYDVVGMDYIPEAIEKINKETNIVAETGDILNMHYEDEKFSSVMAFGLYHSLPPKLQDRAFSETKRILEKDGILVCSFRADNINTRISDWLRAKESRHAQREFHKLNLTKKEFNDILTKNGFSILKIEPVVNMPILYKYKLFRHKKHKIFNEHIGRKEGYRLNAAGNLIMKALMSLFPDQTCNIFLAVAKK